jgi:hypothetical protein
MSSSHTSRFRCIALLALVLALGAGLPGLAGPAAWAAGKSFPRSAAAPPAAASDHAPAGLVLTLWRWLLEQVGLTARSAAPLGPAESMAADQPIVHPSAGGCVDPNGGQYCH